MAAMRALQKATMKAAARVPAMARSMAAERVVKRALEKETMKAAARVPAMA